MHREIALGFGALFVCIFGWGFSTNFIEFGLKEISFLPYLFYRFFVATIILTPFALLFKFDGLKTTIKFPLIWAIGISEAIGLLFQYFAISFFHVSAGFAALFSLLFVLLVPFLSLALLKEQLQPLHLLAVGIGLVGVIFVSTKGNFINFFIADTLGILFLIVTAFAFAFYLVFTAKLQQTHDVDTFALFYLVILIISLTTGITMFVFGSFVLPTLSAWFWIVSVVVISTIISFFAYFYAQERLNQNLVSVLLLGQLIIPFTIDFFYLNRNYNILVYIGLVIITLSMIVAAISPIIYNKTQASENEKPNQELSQN